MISTADDIILFLDAMSNGGVGANGYRILTQETIDLMRTDQLKRYVQAGLLRWIDTDSVTVMALSTHAD